MSDDGAKRSTGSPSLAGELQRGSKIASGAAADFAMPWRKHFGVECKVCDRSYVVEISADQVEACMRDPVEGLRSLPADAQEKIAEFWDQHARRGHQLNPFVAELAALPKG